MDFIEEKKKALANLQLEEYGKWKIDRNVAVDFLESALIEQRTKIREMIEVELSAYCDLGCKDHLLFSSPLLKE